MRGYGVFYRLGSHCQSGFLPASHTTLTSLINYDLSNTYSNPIAFTRVLQVSFSTSFKEMRLQRQPGKQSTVYNTADDNTQQSPF